MKIGLILTILSVNAYAQVYKPPPGGQTTNQSNQGGGNTTIERPPQQQAAPIMGNEVPFVDPSAETVTFNGRNFAIADNRLFAARFERYLNEPEDNSEEAVVYRQTIDQILTLVSPHNPGGPNLSAAVRLLPKASSFPGDAKLCDSLSQAIYVAWMSKNNIKDAKNLMVALEEEKKQIIRSTDWLLTHDKDNALNQTGAVGAGGGGGGGANGAPGQRSGAAQDPGRGAQSLRVIDNNRRILEIEALKKKYELKGEVQIVQAKIQYQALMMQMFIQRRFQHVLMASRFYNQIWTDGDSKLHIDKNSDTSKLFNETVGFNPTVASLDTFASEFIRDCDKGVEAFNFLADKKELESAAKRLSEAYAVGEFMPGIRTLPRERKRKVLEFVRESYKLLAALDMKDYTTATEITNRMKSMSTDFNASKPEGAIATYTRVANMHIMKAKSHAINNEQDKANEEIEKAAQVWPLNPKLSEIDDMITNGSEIAKAKNDFDRLLSENNYRQIFAEQYRIAPSIRNDPQRSAAFEEIITNLRSIESSIAKANEFSKMDQDYAAYEQLAEVRERFPDDPKLGREIELLAPKVADFTKAINKAQQLEKRTPKQTGSAFAWYLKAQKIYSSSKIAEAGIARLLNEIIPDENAEDSPTVKGTVSKEIDPIEY